ncbi:MAG: VTT domain-containing protein [Peptococcaceae bacterium]|jgi:uncharacterized membrane protein YdjX (TVP38/TMEM64 family)|nr:VTT domain-containing protein [Peptococcaceae bacterium]
MLNQRTIPKRFNSKHYIHLSLVLLMMAVLVGGFFYFDRRYALSAAILRLGLLGNVLTVLLMALLYMTPIPSEGLLIMGFKVYGVYLGIFLSWLGMDLGAVITFFLARVYGQKLVQRVVPPEQFAMVDNWVKTKGTTGLLIARLLPVPAFAINCVAGAIPSVEFWPYLWTAAVSIVPYYVGTALVFLGIYMGTWRWLILGALAIAVFGGGGYVLKRRLP